MHEAAPEPPIEDALRRVAEVRNAARNTAKLLGIKAVQEGAMYRTEVAELLDVHPITVSRWVNAANAAPDEASSES